MHTIKCRKCDGQFNLKTLSRLKGRCPSCGALVPVLDYCAYIPERRWWRLFSAAPIGMKCVAFLCGIVCAFFLPCQVLLVIYKLFEGLYCHEGLHMMFGPGFHLALGCAGLPRTSTCWSGGKQEFRGNVYWRVFQKSRICVLGRIVKIAYL